MKRWFQIALASVSLMVALTPTWAQVVQETAFTLNPQAKFVNCLGVPYGPTPTADVVVQRGALNDVLILRAHHLKPNIDLDLFTIQNSNLLANGQKDTNFKNFGLAWYQADVRADSNGEAEVAVKTILLDQIFGFDPAVALLPTNTLHVGLWFDNPKDAEACGFDITHPTPFNGSHNAGPNAMISLPDAATTLGPLCTAPLKQGNTFVCNINN
jgi:hypothetical protein